MEVEDILKLIDLGETLKRIRRTGWLMIGVMPNDSESVADHSYGTALTALITAYVLDESGIQVDLCRVLAMAILHDLPESEISDIPTSEYLPGRENLVRAKEIAEAKVMREGLYALGNVGEKLHSDWEELTEGKTAESRIIHSADAIDMLVHALALERAGMNPELFAEFFVSAKKRIESLQIPLFMELFNKLEEKHLNNIGERGQT